MTRKKSDHAKGKSVACKLGALSDNGNRKTARNVTRAAAGVVVGPGEGGIRLIDETSARDFNDLSSEVCETKVVGLASPTELEPYDTFTSDEGLAAYDASRPRDDHSRTDNDREKVAIKLTIGKRKNAMKTASDSCYDRDNVKSHNEYKTPETEDTYDFEENERNCNNNNNISGSERLPTTVTDSSDDLFKPILTPEGDRVLEVQCGENQALLYLAKLCQGSKGACIRWGVEWLTPNQFQKASGRQTAKDWKRSIRHHGKSMKLLLNKGFISIHSLVCACIQCHDQPLYKRRLQRRADKPNSKLTGGNSADLASITNDSGAVTVNKSHVYDEDDAASDSTIEMTEYSVRDVIAAKTEPELVGAVQNPGNHDDTSVVAMGKPQKIDEKKKKRKLKREREAEGDSLVGDCEKVRCLNESERLRKKKRRKERKKRRIADEMRRVGTMEVIGTGTMEVIGTGTRDLVKVPRAIISAVEEKGTHTGSIDEASNETLVVTEEEGEKCIEKAANVVYVGYDAKQNDASAAKLNLYEMSDVKMCDMTGKTNSVKYLTTRNHNDEKLTERLNVVDPAEITVSSTNYPDSNADTSKSPTSTVGTVNNKGDDQMKDLSGTSDMGDQRESRLGSIINRLNKGLLKSETPQEIDSPDTHQEHPRAVELTAIDENGNKRVVSQELKARQNEIVDNATARDKDACRHNEEEPHRCKSPPERDDVTDAGSEDVQISTHKPRNTQNSVSPLDIDASLIEDDQVRKSHTGRKKVTAEVRPYGFLFNQVTKKRDADNDKDEVIGLIAPANPEKADAVARFSSPGDVIASVYGSDNASGQTSPCKDILSGSNQGQTKHKSQREDVQTNKFSSLTRVSNKQTIATVAPRVTITPKSNVTSYTPSSTPTSSSTSTHNDITPLSASHQRDSALQQYPFNMPFPFPYAMPFAFPGWLPMAQDTAAFQKNGTGPFGLNSMTDQSYMRGYLPMTAPYCYNPYLTNPLFSPYTGYLPSQTQQKDESKTRPNPLAVSHKSPTSSGNYSSSKSSPQYQTNGSSSGNSTSASKRSHKDAGLDLSKKSTTDNLPLNLSVAKKHASSEKHEKSRSRSMTNGHSSAKKAKTSRESNAVGHNRDSDVSKSHQRDGNSVQSKPGSESTKPVAINKPSNTHDLNSQVNHDVIFCQTTQNTDTITTLQNDNALKKGKSSTCKCRQKGTKYPNIWKWDVDQVCSFLSALNGCAHYAEVFRHHHIDGMVLPLLTVDQLMKSLQMTLRPAVLLVETVSKLLDAYSRDLCESCRSQRLVV